MVCFIGFRTAAEKEGFAPAAVIPMVNGSAEPALSVPPVSIVLKYFLLRELRPR
jgi:hypothetical protein